MAISPQIQPSRVPALLTQQRAQIMAALPKHIDPDRFLRIALTELRKTPLLEQCDPKSFLGAVIQAAQLGLEIGSGLGHVYLIPYKNNKRGGIYECQMMLGYKGKIELARRSGFLLSIYARIVHRGDVFRVVFGDNEKITHEPNLTTSSGEVTHVYAVAQLRGGGIQREIMSYDEIEKIRKRARFPNPVWETDFEEMAKKTVLNRLCKILPQSPEISELTEYDPDEESPPSPRPDPERYRQLLDAPDIPGASDLEVAEHVFDEAIAAFKGDPAKVLGAPPAAIRDRGDPAELHASAEKLTRGAP